MALGKCFRPRKQGRRKQITMDKVEERARITLGKAQVLCRDVELRIRDVEESLAHWQRTRGTLRFLVRGLAHQMGFLEHCVLEHGIGKCLITVEWDQVVLGDLVEEMKLWYDRISDKIHKLDEIQNILVTGDVKLGEYISKDQALALKHKLDEIPIIKPQVDNIKSQYNTMRKRVRTKMIERKLNEIETLFNSQFSDTCIDTVQLNDKYPARLELMEDELVEFINSLTAHFDKCKLLNLGELDGTEEFDDLLEIVTADDQQLDEIINHLKETIERVDHVINGITTILESKSRQKIVLHGKINELISSCQKYNEYLSIFKGIAKSIDKFKEGCVQEIELTKELHKFYDGFETSYGNLLSEYQRRKTLARKMQDIIQECQTKLETLHQKDVQERSKFLNDNGNFLPETIWPDQINDLSPLYSLEYHVKEI